MVRTGFGDGRRVRRIFFCGGFLLLTDVGKLEET